jgi:hypothetical protein
MKSPKAGANSKTMRTVISLRFVKAYGGRMGPHILLPAYNQSPPVTPQNRLPPSARQASAACPATSRNRNESNAHTCC